jgi:hypothetical protein
MDTRTFIRALVVQTSLATVESVLSILREPPGPAPDQRYVGLSAWYERLTENDRMMVRESVREAAEQAVFNFLTILDGVSAIENSSQKGNLRLYFVKDEKSVLLNDPNEEELHNLFTEAATDQVTEALQEGLDAYEVGTAADLLLKSRIGNGTDVHHVPRKHAAKLTILDYSSVSAPAIALPKGEH